MRSLVVISFLVLYVSGITGCLDSPGLGPVQGSFQFTFKLELVPSDLNASYNIIVPGFKYTTYNSYHVLEKVTKEGNGNFQFITTQYGQGINITAQGIFNMSIIEDVPNQDLFDMYEFSDTYYYHIYLSNSTENFTVNLFEYAEFSHPAKQNIYMITASIEPGWQLVRGIHGGFA